MKISSYTLVLAALIGAASCEPLKAQEVPAKTIVQMLVGAYNSVADVANPWKLPERYCKFAWFAGSELTGAVSEACAKKECNERLGYACLQGVGFLTITFGPWLVWRLWGKDAYNRQVGYYVYIRETTQKHLIQLKHKYSVDSQEKANVEGYAKLCNKSLFLYLMKDSVIESLVTNFYNNINNPTYLEAVCEQIKLHCDGYIT